jgi:gliding motility-associated lipoprotein GldD
MDPMLNPKRKGCPDRVAFAGFGTLLWVLMLTVTLASCKKASYPKPLASPRIDYPSEQYRHYDKTGSPVRFEYPSYGELTDQHQENKNWMNLRFERYSATLYLSFSNVPASKIQIQIEEKEKMVNEQAPPASVVRKETFESADHQIVGYFYLTDGNAASPVQFLLSDQMGKLFQGSLLFDMATESDSMETVVEGLTRDIRHLVETFRFN